MIFDKVWRLERQRKRIANAYKKDISKAKNIEDRESLQQSEWFELEMIDDEIQELLTDRLREEARKLDISIPSGEKTWVRSRHTGRSYLYKNVRYDLAQQIRKEKKEQREYRLGFWKDILLLATGVAAIASSVWSILKK